MEVKSYRDLKIWQAGVDLVVDIYRLTAKFPDSERFALCSQLQRAAVSVPSNIAEGHARDSSKDFLRFLSIALGSLAEVETQLVLAKRLAYLGPADIEDIFSKTRVLGKMVRGLQKTLRSKI